MCGFWFYLTAICFAAIASALSSLRFIKEV